MKDFFKFVISQNFNNYREIIRNRLLTSDLKLQFLSSHSMIAFSQLKKKLQTTFYILAAILLLVNTCPVKKAIQSQDIFAGQAINQNAQNKMISPKATCAIDSELQFAAIGQTSFEWNNNLFPLVLFTALFSGLLHLFITGKKAKLSLVENSRRSSPLRLHVKHCVFII